MENPTFYMEGIIKSRDEMEDFEGPLTLLLHLLSKNKIEIADIQISEICDQYIQYLEQMKEMDLEVASEFVQMASHLVYIKTKSLLVGDEEIPELEMLISSMEELQRKDQYMQIRAVTEQLGALYARGGGYGEKPPEYLAPEQGYRYDHQVVDLLEALGRIFERGFDQIETEGRQFVMPTRIVYSVTEKAEEIVTRLKVGGEMPIRTLFLQSKSRSEVVATLIAVLELCKMGSIRFVGEGEDMVVGFTGVEASAITLEEGSGGE